MTNETDQVSLLPQGATPWELAQARASAARRPLDVDIIRRVWNPWTCPVELLPWLAWTFGLEIWKDEWPESKKRDVVSRIWLLKRRKTTLQGIKDYLDLVGSSVESARRPRDKMWFVPSMTEEERTALNSRMPEIRVYPSPPIDTGQPVKAFWGRSFYNFSALCQTDAPARWLDRASYVDGGVETRVSVRGIASPIDESYTIELAASAPAKAFYNRLALRDFRIPSDASEHILAISPNEQSSTFAIPPGLIPRSVRPVRVAETVAAPVYKSFRFPTFYNASAYIPSDAHKHLFDSWRFLDPKRVGAFGKPISFWGWSKSSPGAYRAELTLRVPLDEPSWAFRRVWGQGFWHKADTGPLWDALEAITIAQAARDDIFASLKLYEPMTFQGGLRFGDFNFGDDRKVA